MRSKEIDWRIRVANTGLVTLQIGNSQEAQPSIYLFNLDWAAEYVFNTPKSANTERSFPKILYRVLVIRFAVENVVSWSTTFEQNIILSPAGNNGGNMALVDKYTALGTTLPFSKNPTTDGASIVQNEQNSFLAVKPDHL
eukprot:scaffold3714_cov113-Cylindrotheca_fusiformis.AAC.3